jgi:hypothetical protein
MRASDIDDTIFKQIENVGIVGNIECRNCHKSTTVKQSIIYVPVTTPARRKGDL